MALPRNDLSHLVHVIFSAIDHVYTVVRVVPSIKYTHTLGELAWCELVRPVKKPVLVAIKQEFGSGDVGDEELLAHTQQGNLASRR